jgi:outer membrane lipoprotein-sorting protein
MKYLLRSALVLLVLASAHTASAQTADEILEKSIAAMGGRAAFDKIKSRSMSGTITLNTPAGDLPGTIEILNARPNKTRMLIKADLTQFGAGMLEIDQRFDGQNGFVLNTLQGNRDITGNQLDNMRNIDFPHGFLTYKEAGFKVTLQGKEKVGSGEAYVVVMEPKAGSTIRQFIDAETLLPVRFMVKANVPELGTDVEQTTDLLSYRDVDGVKLPFKLTSSSSMQSFTIDVGKVEHNVTVDEKLFVKP